ncbi:MAG TPA: hypothetical protein VFK80_11460 [Limnochordia bacterium]|nr:hypothetical protein [Limnochordia bacterium]
MSSQSPGPPAGAAGIIDFASLAAHHRWLVFYGLIQVAAAFLATLLVRLDPARISLELPGREEGLSHPVLVVWLVLVLATAALTYAAAGAARSAWWLRLAVALAVGGMLAQLAYAAGVSALAAPPIVVVLGLILWGRRAESARHPHPQLFGGIGLCIAVVWLLIAGFGLRPPEMGALGALYLALSVLTAGAAFVPVPILLLSGLDLAEAAEAWASRLSQWGGRLGEQAPAALLLVLAVLKLAFTRRWARCTPIRAGGLRRYSRWPLRSWPGGLHRRCSSSSRAWAIGCSWRPVCWRCRWSPWYGCWRAGRRRTRASGFWARWGRLGWRWPAYWRYGPSCGRSPFLRCWRVCG